MVKIITYNNSVAKNVNLTGKIAICNHIIRGKNNNNNIVIRLDFIITPVRLSCKKRIQNEL